MPDSHSHAVYELRNGIPCGRYLLKLARTDAELESVFKLRYRVFNDELGEGIPENAGIQMDVDDFDRHCDHLMVLDHGDVIGTYRLLYGPKRPPQGFYSETEFNLKALQTDPNITVEMGRGCIDSQHRKRTTLMALFWGLHRYLMMRKARYLLGCGSLPIMSPNDAEASFAELLAMGKVDFPPGFGPLPANQFQGDATLGTAQVPPLVSLYLEFGARIMGRPAYDPVFKCHDLFVVLDMQHLSNWGVDLLARFDRRLI